MIPPPLFKGKHLEPRKRELLAASNLYRAFAMIKFFHSTRPHVILTKPDVWMFSLISHMRKLMFSELWSELTKTTQSVKDSA